MIREVHGMITGRGAHIVVADGEAGSEHPLVLSTQRKDMVSPVSVTLEIAEARQLAADLIGAADRREAQEKS